jgi:predicted MFS family arabinose efflux permease
VRRTLLVALFVMASATGLSSFMTSYWQLIATWGVLSGLGSGCVTVVLAATMFATFFVCGATTNGLVGTHLIAMCGDNGVPELKAAGLLAMMGVFDLIGTTLSGWLTDRYDARKLLFVYYVLRGLSLIWLPYSDFTLYNLSIFSVFYGLDWIATVPPTLRLTNAAFGDAKGPMIFGWIVAGHQLGAASATMFAGAMRTSQGNYIQAFASAGSAAVLAGLLALLVGQRHTGPSELNRASLG